MEGTADHAGDEQPAQHHHLGAGQQYVQRHRDADRGRRPESTHGTILLQSIDGAYADILALAGTFTNAADGTIQVGTGSGGGRFLNGNLINFGNIDVGPNTNLTVNSTSSAATFTNEGQVTVDAAGLMTVGKPTTRPAAASPGRATSTTAPWT